MVPSGALSREEWDSLRSQFATLKSGRGQHHEHLGYAYTEHRALMAANEINSRHVIEVSVDIVPLRAPPSCATISIVDDSCAQRVHGQANQLECVSDRLRNSIGQDDRTGQCIYDESGTETESAGPAGP